MPRGLPRFAFCAGPGDAKSHKTIGGLLGFLIGLWFSSATAAIFFSVFLGFVIPILLLGGCLGVIPAVITIVALLQEAKDWYYHERLLCIEDRNNCVVGSVLVEPEVSTDGDRKLNLLLAPFTEAECFELLCRHLNDNEGLLNSPAPFIEQQFFPGAPPVQFVPFNADILDDPNASPDERRAERKKVADYLRAIRGHDEEDDDATSKAYNNMLIGWMDRLLDASNVDKNNQPKNFQGRFYRKDPNVIPPGTPLSDAIPPDFDPATPWQAVDGSLSPVTQNNPYEDSFQPRPLNAMFRFDHSREADPENPDRLLPYLHCEIDGNWVQLFLDELSLAISSFGVAYFFLCIALPWPLSLLAGPIAALLALLIFLLQRWLDGGSDRGQAEPPDVEYDDPDNFGESGDSLDGDLVTILGPWIMDTEHTQYFEIHPVEAYYVVARNGRGAIELFDSAAEQIESGSERLHNGMVDATMAAVICGMANQAEGEDPPPVITRTAPTLLSHGLRTNYGGGGFGAVVR
jgi:hypothetical protein